MVLVERPSSYFSPLNMASGPHTNPFGHLNVVCVCGRGWGGGAQPKFILRIL